jgi:hypothetical protein
MAEGDGRKEKKGGVPDAGGHPRTPNAPSPGSILAWDRDAHCAGYLRGPRVALCTLA